MIAKVASDTTEVVHITYEEMRMMMTAAILAQGNLSAAQALLSEAMRPHVSAATVVDFHQKASELIEGALTALIYDENGDRYDEEYV